MKIAARVFVVLSMLAAIIACAIMIPTAIACMNPSDELLKQVAQSSPELAKLSTSELILAVNAVGITFWIMIAYAVICLVFCIVDLVALAKPLKGKPIALGILSIFFVNIIAGVLLLCMNGDEEKKQAA